MSKKLPNVIAAEHLENVSTWQLPSMDGSGNVVPSAEKELRDRAHRVDEVIEDVEDDESIDISPITAEELQEITEAAEREGFELGKKEGFDSGQKEGHAAGYQAGMEQAQAEVRETLEKQVSQLLQIAETLIEPIDKQQLQLQNTLLQFVTSLTEQVIERELIQDSSHILSCVKQAIAALPIGAEGIRVVLNPDDLALVESYSEEFDKGWKFQGDNQLLPGGCRIETRESLVDFSVESKIKAMFSQFLDQQLTDSTATDRGDTDVEPIGDQPSVNLGAELATDATTDQSASESVPDMGASAAETPLEQDGSSLNDERLSNPLRGERNSDAPLEPNTDTDINTNTDNPESSQ